MDNDIQNIIFDVGMVLIDFCWERYCRNLGFDEKVIEAFGKNMISSEYWDMLDEGTIEEQDAIQEFIIRMPQYRQEIEKFWDNPVGVVEEYNFAAPMISKLKERGYYVYLLSNYPANLYKLHWSQFSFFTMVDGYVVSALEKLKKPDLAIYKLICERYHLKAEECLFVDDRQVNVEAARMIGMQSVLFKDYETIRSYMNI